MKFKALFFDIDGTIIPVESVTKCLRDTFEHFGHKMTLKKIKVNTIGYKTYESVPRLFPKEKRIKKISSYYENLYVKNYRKYSGLLPHVKSTFKFLSKKKLKIGIVTTKSRRTALAVLNGFRINYDVLVSSDDVKRRKPYPEPVLKTCKMLGVRPKDCIFFGDHVFDMKAAKAAGCEAVGVLTGMSKKEELKKSGADFIIRNLKEVKGLIE